MPKTAQAMADKLGFEISGLKDFDVAKEIKFFNGGEKFVVGDMLFERITPEKIDEMKAKYGSAE